MPIYAYRCAACGHAKDALQKISDPVLTVCPSCGAAALQKQVTAAGFQLKGSGWYVTDFRGDAKADKDGKEAGKEGNVAPASAAASEGKESSGKDSVAGAVPAAPPAPAPAGGTPSAAASSTKPTAAASTGNGSVGGQ